MDILFPFISSINTNRQFPNAIIRHLQTRKNDHRRRNCTGLGVFYSSETGTLIRGHWVDDVLDGPCEIILSDGRRPNYSGLRFRQNVLYGTPSPPPPMPVPVPKTTFRRGRAGIRFPVVQCRRFPVPITSQCHRLPVAIPKSTTSFRRPCDRQITETAVTGNNIRMSDDNGSNLVRADVRLTTTDEETSYDLTGHVRKMASVRAENYEFCDQYNPCHRVSAVVVDSESQIRAAESVLKTHTNHLKELYRAYGAYLANGPIVYRPLMTRLGLWQMIINSGLHARVSLADFDDLLCKYIIVV